MKKLLIRINFKILKGITEGITHLFKRKKTSQVGKEYNIYFSNNTHNVGQTL